MARPSAKYREVIPMSEQEKNELAKTVAELIREDGAVRSALLEAVCSCPNVMVQH